MKLQQLRYLAAVVEHGGVTKAAEHLNLSQPALSAGLRALEAELGGALFERSRGRLRLTPQGLRFHQRATAILRDCDAAQRDFGSGRARLRIRLGVLGTLAESGWLSDTLALLRRHEHVAVEVREGSVEQLSRWLARQAIEVALTTQGSVRSGTESRAVGREPFVVLLPPGDPLAQAAVVRLADLSARPFVLRTGCEMRRQVEEAGARLDVVARTGQDTMARRLVAEGVGITLAPASLAGPGILARPVSDLSLNRTVTLCWRRDLDREIVAALRGMPAPDSHQRAPKRPTPRPAVRRRSGRPRLAQ